MRLVIYTLLSKVKDFFKVTGSYVHWKSGNISEMVLDRGCNSRLLTLIYGLFYSSSCDDIECLKDNFPVASLFNLMPSMLLPSML